jgi:GNAT superfamily N-acetyltransferase
MHDDLDIHAASTSERIALYTNTYEFWGAPGATLEDHIAERMNSPQHNRATWYAGCIDGRPVCGLGAYPMEFLVRGRVLPGISIGSVHTVPRCRKRGYAAQILQWVEDRERGRGARLSLLYSNVKPEYYGQFGYQLCPCWHGRLDVNSIPASSIPRTLNYERVQPVERRAEIESLYRAHHGHFPISIHRGPRYWDYVFEKGAAHESALLTDGSGRPRGYVELATGSEMTSIIDWAADDPGDEAALEIFRALVREGAARGWKSIGGWLPDNAAVRSMFVLTNRPEELTMLKSFADDIVLDDNLLHSAQHFREIDHV